MTFRETNDGILYQCIQFLVADFLYCHHTHTKARNPGPVQVRFTDELPITGLFGVVNLS